MNPSPTVLFQVQTFNSSDWVITRTTGQSSDSFLEEFDSTPSVIAKLGSYYGADTANLRLDNITSTGPHTL